MGHCVTIYIYVMTAQAGARSTAKLFLHDHRPCKRESWPLQLHHDVSEGHVDEVPRAAKRQRRASNQQMGCTRAAEQRVAVGWAERSGTTFP